MDITSESSVPVPYCADIATHNAATINGSYYLNLGSSGVTATAPRPGTTEGLGLEQGFLQLQAWVSANGVLKDCMIKLYL